MESIGPGRYSEIAAMRSSRFCGFICESRRYADFCRFIESRDVPYESESRRALTELKKAAEKDRYEEVLKGAIEALDAMIKDDKMSNMETYREEIEYALAGEIVLRYA